MKLIEKRRIASSATRLGEDRFKVLGNPNEPDEAKRSYDERTWGIEPPAGHTAAKYLANILGDFKAELQEKYKAGPAETTLPGEGSDL